MSQSYAAFDELIEKYVLGHPKIPYFLSVEAIICQLFGRLNKRGMLVLECHSANAIRQEFMPYAIYDEADKEYYVNIFFLVFIYDRLGRGDAHDLALKDESDLGKDFMNAIELIRRDLSINAVLGDEQQTAEVNITKELYDIKKGQERIISLLSGNKPLTSPTLTPVVVVDADLNMEDVAYLGESIVENFNMIDISADGDSDGDSDDKKPKKKSTAVTANKEPIAGNIYLLYFKDNKEYYKVGRTKQTLKDRLKKYKNYTLIHSKSTNDIVGVENKIIEDFGKKYKSYKGREWFVGGKADKEEMIKIIDTHIP